MSDIAIQVEGLSKQFRIGKQQQSRTFRETLNDAAAAPFKRIGGLLRGNASAAANLTETIWALKDVSFEVKKGEVVGIIGRNGAGKSTLLKILSQITEPTEGRVKLYGRVGALLEVGTGFHSELTGRENIYLNGAILGMSRAEINRKFDEIVAFAEVEKFIDTPVKRYSSGMYLRLAFAVAAHLEPEILLVDEVLAVGDAAFQKKCLGKMSDVAGQGRTVLFVSHNIGAIRVLSNRVFLLANGSIVALGSPENTINTYFNSQLTSDRLSKPSGRYFRNLFATCAPTEAEQEFLFPLRAAEIMVTWCSTENVKIPGVYVAVYNTSSELLFAFDNLDFQQAPALEKNQQIVFKFRIGALPLMPGNYHLRLHIKNHSVGYGDIVDDIFPFEVHPGPIHNQSYRELLSTWFGSVVIAADLHVVVDS
ncbi:MAG: ABC transporter ATP-binding protein [Aggregatilineales bacterium]